MARIRQPRDIGPPGLGGKVSDDIADGENPTPGSENSPLDGTNRQPNEIPWSGRGIPQAGVLGSETGDLAGLMALPQMITEQGQRFETLWSEFLDQNAVVEQIGGQQRALEQTVAQGMGVLEQCRNAIITLEQRLNALAQQQLQTNTRMAALQLAVQAKSSHETPAKVVEQAERFYQFLLGDLATKVTPPSPKEVIITDGSDPENPTQH